MSHVCHAHGCNRRVPPSMFACKPHWFALPKPIRDAIWQEYREGQEDDKRPSLRYLAVQQLAVATLAYRDAVECAEFMTNAQEYRRMAIEAGQGDPLEGLLPAR